MFRNMIAKCSDSWYNSDDCPVKEMISYMSMRGALRDAQIEAIKVYLFLKLPCNNEPLAKLFIEGRFNTLDLEEEELKKSTREYLMANPGAASLYEYCVTAMQISEDKSNLEKILKNIKNDPSSINYERVFSDIFYNVTYSDYIFSLPMGAGKTFLMAAFIYLDLYFSSMDPENKAFAQNFIVLAPSGLKSSIIPSLKTIKNFDPAWVLPDEVARSIRKEIVFESLESNSSASKSNNVKNPNARKVGLYLRHTMRGIIFVTNAEKVILDRMNAKKIGVQKSLEDEKLDILSNELRFMIGSIPHLSIIIDEVHHASDDSIKLRQVVSKWAEKDTVVTVIGFSGTPYLQKPEKIPIVDKIAFSSTEINNVVFYYPLTKGIGNFLKVPSVKQYENRDAYTEIVENGLREFFAMSKDTMYKNNTCSKIAIYCNCIEELENEVYASASKICAEFGLPSSESILKYHDGNKEYKLAPDAKMEFETLDTQQSKIRIVLLVQIGKEGWDCRSLTGVILAKENKSTRNMVLQTCCRCLRQVDKYDYDEKAYIYLCKSNAELLEAQLKADQHITLKEFQQAAKKPTTKLDFYNRKRVIELPPIDFYQFLVKYEVISEVEPNIDANLRNIPLEDLRIIRQVITKDFDNNVISRSDENDERGKSGMNVATFSTWISGISKESFGNITAKQLMGHQNELKKIFDTVTFKSDDITYYSSKFEQEKLRSLIRQSFYAKRRLNTTEEYIEQSRELLVVVNFEKGREVSDPEMHYPDQDAVHKTMTDDKNGFTGRELMRRRYHYMPYHLDSKFEISILKHIQELSSMKDSKLEVYYNGDRFLTEFHIKCYEKIGPRWNFIGQYTPDFLILERKDGEIHKALIIETKGQIYSQDEKFLKKKEFVEEYFLDENQKRYGYRKFDYLYIEDTMSEGEQHSRIQNKINSFFGVNR